MPRGVAHGPETRSFVMGLHAQGRSLSDLSREFEIPRQVLSRWWQRLQADGLDGLTPRSRRPHRSHAIARGIVRRILRLRQRRLGPARIAALVGVSAKTVHRVLTRHGQARLPRPRRPPSRRYGESRPGSCCTSISSCCQRCEMPAMTMNLPPSMISAVKPSWRLRPSRRPRRPQHTRAGRRAVALSRGGGADRQRVGFHDEARLAPRAPDPFRAGLPGPGDRPPFAPAAAPQSNGKVERFFRTVDDECLALQRQWTFTHRTRAVDRFVRFYNHERPHLSLSGMTPVQRRDSYFRSLRPELMY